MPSFTGSALSPKSHGHASRNSNDSNWQVIAGARMFQGRFGTVRHSTPLSLFGAQNAQREALLSNRLPTWRVYPVPRQHAWHHSILEGLQHSQPLSSKKLSQEVRFRVTASTDSNSHHVLSFNLSTDSESRRLPANHAFLREL